MKPLVLVHGFMGGAAQWNGQVAALSTKREVVALDLPGYGAANNLAPINTIEGFADWVISALDARGIEAFDLLGHSMGGMIVQEIARLVPDRIGKLILYATGSVGVLPGRFETIAESKARAEVDGAETTARRIAATWFLNGERDPAYRTCADIAAKSSLAAIKCGLTAMETWSGQQALADIRAETQIIWGDQDRTYPWSQINSLWTGISQCHLAVLPRCAHAVHLERPAAFNELLDDFLVAPQMP